MLTKGKICNKKQEEIRGSIIEEYNKKIIALRKRDDFSPYFAYFLDILSLLAQPGKIKEKFSKPLAALYCTAAPLEIFDFFWFSSGSIILWIVFPGGIFSFFLTNFLLSGY